MSASIRLSWYISGISILWRAALFCRVECGVTTGLCQGRGTIVSRFEKERKKKTSEEKRDDLTFFTAPVIDIMILCLQCCLWKKR